MRRLLLGLLLPALLHSAEWQVNGVACSTGASGETTITLAPEKISRGTLGVIRRISRDEFRGQEITCSVDVKAVDLIPGPKALHYHGGKFMLVIDEQDRKIYPGQAIPYGTYDWRTVRFSAAVPSKADGILLHIGFQNASGQLSFRNLKIEAGDRMIDFSQAANMGFADESPGDGKGGWSDQGRDNDARNFDFRKLRYGNVPFQLLDPARNGGKSILAMKSANFPAGLEHARLTGGSGKELYLLHALSHSGEGVAGHIDLSGKNGEKHTIDIVDQHDVGDWWHPRRLANAWPGAGWNTAGGGTAGLFVSRFSLPFAPESITFRSANGRQTWLIAGATLSEKVYVPEENTEFVIRESALWKSLKRPAAPRIVPGSALDISALLPQLPLDRVIRSGDRLAFSRNPSVPIRFFCATANMNGRAGAQESNFDTREKIDAFVEELSRQGYNMYRIHLPNISLGHLENGEVRLKADELDRYDYFIAKCKEKHIYLMVDALGREVGYSGVNPWSHAAFAQHYNLRIYFDETVRAQCREGMRQFFTHRNPYTGLSMVEDPIIAVITGWNEQEFAFIRKFDFRIAHSEFRRFLEQKYATTAELNQAWNTAHIAFEEAAAFTHAQISEKSRRGADIDLFIREKEGRMIRWYEETLREFGYKGLFTNYDMTKSLHYSSVRSALELVSMHTYHAHPNYGKGYRNSTQSQGSALEGASGFFRDAAATRIAGKPFIVNEYAQLWWNRYRYEEPYAFTAYASLHGFSALLRHSHPVSTVNAEYMNGWESFWDPIANASQTASVFLYLRGDVKEATGRVKLRFSGKAVNEALLHRDSLEGIQSRLALITGFGLEDTDYTRTPPCGNELVIPLAGTAAVTNDIAGFSQSEDRTGTGSDLTDMVETLKKKGVLPERNRSGSYNLFESETGELLLDANRKFMSVNSPRFQGISGPAGSGGQLSDLTVERITTDGSFSVIALDGELRTAKRLLVIYATNALNAGDSFEDESMRLLLRLGRNPSLIRTGSFSAKLRNVNADAFRFHPLEMNGARRPPLPVKAENGVLTFSADTGKLAEGPVLYFELVAESL